MPDEADWQLYWRYRDQIGRNNVKFDKKYEPKMLLNDGWYDATICMSEESETKAGKQYLKMTFEVPTADGAFFVSPAFGGFWPESSESCERLKELAGAAGVLLDADMNVDASAFLNKRVKINVQREKGRRRDDGKMWPDKNVAFQFDKAGMLEPIEDDTPSKSEVPF